MDVSVIIINYNTFDMTVNCIRSVIEKTSNVDYEIILVDNASEETDPGKFKDLFPEIQLIKSNINGGFAKGNNMGIASANGDIVLLLNSDTELINNAVYEAYKVLSQSNDVGVVTGRLRYKSGVVQAVTGRFPSISREIFDLFRLSKFLSKEKKKTIYLGTQADYSTSFECDWVWGSFFMFRMKDLLLFPDRKLHEDYFMYYEDVQWCYYFKKVLHKKIVYSPLPQLFHYIGGSDPYQNLNKKYFEKIFPNEMNWMRREKGLFYCKLYYFIKSMHLMSSFSNGQRVKGKLFFRRAVLSK